MNGTSDNKRYLQVRPASALHHIIEAIWIQESPHEPGASPTTVVPTGRVELIFHYGDLFVQYDGDRPEPMAMCHVVGQQRQPIVLNSTGRTGVAIVRFTPWGAYCMFGEALAELANQIVDLELIWRPSALLDFRQQLFEARDHSVRAALTEAFVAKRLQHTRPDYLSAESLLAMNQHWGRQRVAEIATDFELSRRQFSRRFTRNVGASPKQLSSVLRAQKATACVRLGFDAQDIVARCGYADQSHFIRDINAHTGMSPSDLARLQASSAHRFFNSNDVERFCGVTYL